MVASTSQVKCDLPPEEESRLNKAKADMEERREAAGDPPATLTPPSIQGWLKECSTQAPPGPSRAAIMLAQFRKERDETKAKTDKKM